MGGEQIHALQQKLNQLAQQYQKLKPEIDAKLAIQQQIKDFRALALAQQIKQLGSFVKHLEKWPQQIPQDFKTEIQELFWAKNQILSSLHNLQKLQTEPAG